VIALLLASGAVTYFACARWYEPQVTVTDGSAAPELLTATVSQGDIVITASGSAELVPAAELTIGFRTSGTIDALLVEVGDRVSAGDLLAELNTDSLERSLAAAEVELQIARLELESVQEGATDEEVADAEAEIGFAETELTLAWTAYEQTEDSRLDGVVESAKVDYDYWVGYYQHQKAEYEAGRLSQADHDWAMAAMIDAEGRWQAAINDAKTEEVQALTRIESAENDLFQAEEELDLLLSQPLSDTLVSAMLDVDAALFNYEQAVEQLENARLYAPFDATVMDIDIAVGEEAEANSTILTLADLDNALLVLWVEEGDLAAVAVGNEATVTFEVLPDETFTATIDRIDPVLVSVDGMTAVQAWATIDLEGFPGEIRSGMTADVEVIAAEARDALLVPIEALRETAPDQYSVFVVGPDGGLELRVVVVGLMDYVNAQVLAGLELGETVSLGEGS
jgi:HlyD family secretion protein